MGLGWLWKGRARGDLHEEVGGGEGGGGGGVDVEGVEGGEGGVGQGEAGCVRRVGHGLAGLVEGGLLTDGICLSFYSLVSRDRRGKCMVRDVLLLSIAYLYTIAREGFLWRGQVHYPPGGCLEDGSSTALCSPAGKWSWVGSLCKRSICWHALLILVSWIRTSVAEGVRLA